MTRNTTSLRELIARPGAVMAPGVADALNATGSIAGIAPSVPGFREFFDLLGMPEVQKLEASYGVEESSRAKY